MVAFVMENFLRNVQFFARCSFQWLEPLTKLCTHKKNENVTVIYYYNTVHSVLYAIIYILYNFKPKTLPWPNFTAHGYI